MSARYMRVRVTELIKELKKLEDEGYGESDVLIADFGKSDNPVPQFLFNVRLRGAIKKVFLESEYRANDKERIKRTAKGT